MPDLYLYSLRDGNVQRQSGLNWGYSDGHVCENDAYIAVTSGFIRANPTFFPNSTNIITVHWDDDIIMDCLLEGTQIIDDTEYYKQISSYNDKSVLGNYLRDRINVHNRRVTLDDLDAYGRRSITVTHLHSNHYLFDFHV